jgi:hypothetical protein
MLDECVRVKFILGNVMLVLSIGFSAFLNDDDD